MSEIVTCPKCSSEHVEILMLKADDVLLEACRDCGAFWEAETRPEPVATPCDNCAWRPGSPERRDPEKWAHLMSEFRRGCVFYCHKRVPAKVTPEGYEFDFELGERNGQQVALNAPACAGWRSWKLGQINKRGSKTADEHTAS